MIGSFFVANFLKEGEEMYVDSKLYAVEELANAIIIKAAHDYREAMKNLWL